MERVGAELQANLGEEGSAQGTRPMIKIIVTLEISGVIPTHHCMIQRMRKRASDLDTGRLAAGKALQPILREPNQNHRSDPDCHEELQY